LFTRERLTHDTFVTNDSESEMIKKTYHFL